MYFRVFYLLQIILLLDSFFFKVHFQHKFCAGWFPDWADWTSSASSHHSFTLWSTFPPWSPSWWSSPFCTLIHIILITIIITYCIPHCHPPAAQSRSHRPTRFRCRRPPPPRPPPPGHPMSLHDICHLMPFVSSCHLCFSVSCCRRHLTILYLGKPQQNC